MKLFILVTVLTLTTLVYADETASSDPLLEAIIVAKNSGMCGVFGQLARFQASTKMPGGDEFLMRFLNTEAARLGQSIGEFMDQCNRVTDYYDAMYESLSANSE